MAENKTTITAVPIGEFLTTIERRRVAEAEIIIEMMQEISGLNPQMWGPSIIGFGSLHYRYASGHEGDMPKLAFSPRKANLVVYFYSGFLDQHKILLEDLGKHRTSAACLYITRLANIDITILRKLLVFSWQEFEQEKHK